MKAENDPIENLINECQECSLCSDACDFLAETRESPAAMARRGIRPDEAFSCALCGRCAAVCPLGLKLYELFAARRAKAVDQKEIDVNEYDYLFPDRPENCMRLYRQYYRIDYNDVEAVVVNL